MTPKDDIIAAIRREAQKRGGRVSIRAFVAATGIGQKEMLGTHWAKWNDALAEAGVDSTSFEARRQSSIGDAPLLEAVARLTQRLGKWPSQAEFSLEHNRDRSFPSRHVVTRAANAPNFWRHLATFCEDRAELQQAREVALARAGRDDADGRASRGSIAGFVYLMRSGKRYKIGRTNSPSRRHREVRLDLPEPTNLVHSIPTDDPPGIETYWHTRFHAKRVRNTEFFELDSADVAAFRRRKYQ